MRSVRILPGLLLLTALPLAAAPPNPSPARVIATHRADLRGTGKKDLIELTKRRIPIGTDGFANEYRVVVNGRVGKVIEIDGDAEGLSSVDVNRADRVREIDVQGIGPSDGQIHHLLRFDGTTIHDVGVLETPRYLGNGIVINSSRQGFWESSHKYVLGKDHRLKELKQEFYHVGYANKLKKPLAIRVKRNQPQVLANLRVGSEVLVMLGDLEGWYLVQSENGLVGWIREAEVDPSFGILSLP